MSLDGHLTACSNKSQHRIMHDMEPTDMIFVTHVPVTKADS